MRPVHLKYLQFKVGYKMKSNRKKNLMNAEVLLLILRRLIYQYISQMI